MIFVLKAENTRLMLIFEKVQFQQALWKLLLKITVLLCFSDFSTVQFGFGREQFTLLLHHY